jgi:DNA-binding MarR family transcriptional regulator
MRPDDLADLTSTVRRQLHGWERLRQLLAAQLELNSSEVVALAHIVDRGRITPSDLGSLMYLSSGTVTAIVDGLEAAAFVERERHPEDGRSVLISARPAGRHASAWVNDRVEERLLEALADSGVDLSSAHAFFGALADGLEAEIGRLSETESG